MWLTQVHISLHGIPKVPPPSFISFQVIHLMSFVARHAVLVRKTAFGTSAAAFAVVLLQACSGGAVTTAPTGAAAAAAGAGAAPGASATALAADPQERATIQSVSIPPASVGMPDAAFSSYESAHVHPLDITPDGSKLLAVNTPNNDLEVFAINGNPHACRVSSRLASSR